MFESAFRVIGQTSESIIIKCMKCAWFDAFEPTPLVPADGLRDEAESGPRPYTEEEIQNIQHLDALADAAEQHRDHRKTTRA